MSALKALHTTVSKADPGDAGWIWFEGDWRLAEIVIDHDTLMVCIATADFLEDEPPSLFAEDAEVAELPWFPISRPPYEGDEKPCTHLLTMQDRGASWTLSWRASEDEGAAISRSVFQHAQSLLKLDKAKGDA